MFTEEYLRAQLPTIAVELPTLATTLTVTALSATELLALYGAEDGATVSPSRFIERSASNGDGGPAFAAGAADALAMPDFSALWDAVQSLNGLAVEDTVKN